MEGKNTYIVRCGEVALKGMNKPYFERMLAERIKKVLKKYEGCFNRTRIRSFGRYAVLSNLLYFLYELVNKYDK